MSSKEGRLRISSEKEEQWLMRMAECSNEMLCRLRGKLLTTLEAALPSGRRLEALKERVKDIQKEVFDRMSQDNYSLFEHWFMVSDEIPDEKPSEEKYNAKVTKYNNFFLEMTAKKFDRFKDTITNLVVIAIEEHERQEALKAEIRRLVDNSSLKLRSWLGRGVNEILLERK